MLLDALAEHVARHPDRPLPTVLAERVLRAARLLDAGASLECACGADIRRRDSALRRCAELLIDDPASAPATAAGAVLRAVEAFERARREPQSEVEEAIAVALQSGPVPRSQRHLARVIAG